MENPEETTTLAAKLKILAVIEAVGFLISLVIPITPSKTGKPFRWPQSWGEYFDEVLLAFLVANVVFMVFFVVSWIFIQRYKKDGTS